MNQDYKTKAERKAYTKGVFANIDGLELDNNPYIQTFHQDDTILYDCWANGHNEKGSISRYKAKSE